MSGCCIIFLIAQLQVDNLAVHELRVLFVLLRKHFVGLRRRRLLVIVVQHEIVVREVVVGQRSMMTVAVFSHVDHFLVRNLTALIAAVFGRHHWILAGYVARPLNRLHRRQGSRVLQRPSRHGLLAIVDISRQHSSASHLLARRDVLYSVAT